jgi:hypothetical protein
MSPALDGYDRPGRTRRGLKAHKARKRALDEIDNEPSATTPGPPPDTADGPALRRISRVQRQDYVRESENAPDPGVVEAVNAGHDLNEIFDRLDGGGFPTWECVFCDEFGSESPAHDPGCSARSISKRKI